MGAIFQWTNDRETVTLSHEIISCLFNLFCGIFFLKEKSEDGRLMWRTM